MKTRYPFIFTIALLVCGSIFAENRLQLGEALPGGVGQDWTLPDGQVVNLQIVANQFHLVFLDQERVIVKPTVAKVIIRGEETRNKTQKLQVTLSAGSGASLSHPRKVYPPYDYWLQLVVPADEASGEWKSLARRRFRVSGDT